jgi:hypothetical protein
MRTEDSFDENIAGPQNTEKPVCPALDKHGVG